MEAVYGLVEWLGFFGRFMVMGLFCTGAILVTWGLASAMRSGRALPSKRYGIAAKLIAGLLLLGTPHFAYRPLGGCGSLAESALKVKPGGF